LTDDKGESVDPIAPHGTVNDKENPQNDIYAQEFFLHSYAIFTSMKDNFLESPEGNTLIKYTDEQRLAKRIVGCLRGPCGNIDKWNAKVEMMI
jgi:hypothetical protein